MTTIKCPSCGNRHRVALFPIQKRQSTFTSEQPFFSNNLFGEVHRFFWFMAGNRPAKQPKNLTINSIIKTSKYQILINKLEIPASTNDLRQLAIVYTDHNKSWSRKNSTSGTKVTQPTHLKIQETFLELHFLQRLSITQYTLTEAGYRFLRHFIDA
jgi:hypothetical protein